MLSMGISRYKCATVAEAEMLADCQAPHILLAYPLVGPNIERYLTLIARYPQSRFYAIGDDAATLRLLSDAAAGKGVVVDTLLDVNLGMNRTGLTVEKALDVYGLCSRMPGLSLCGLHCYDGHHNDKDFKARCERVDEAVRDVGLLIRKLEEQGLSCPIRIMAGTPSFPCHARHADEYLSPGTCFLMDYGYATNVPDLPFVPAAAVLTRVISHPAEGLFTLDLGYKGIASDPAGLRGVIVNLEEAEPALHSEEHWVWRMKPGFERLAPPIGSAWYVIPTHICPTSALYPAALVAEDHQIVGEWPITARNRKLTV
ncbi:MAG TPA: D-TA family PLP-dependent enzyme, partial [Clostridia bacterium]|nr:D-TA family PLP-dependent enzyme [Clostridia bacterium]